MDDLRDRFKLVDRLEAPSMWEAAEARANAPARPRPVPPGPPRPWRRLAVAAASLAIAAAGFAIAVHALRTTPGPKPGGSPLPIGQIDTLPAVAFVDAQHGWAAGGGTIIATTDGGVTWTRQYAGPAGIASLDFVDASHGWAVALAGGLLRTEDGGASWTEAGEPAGMFVRTVDFVSPAEGWGISSTVKGAVPSIQGTLVRTTDGGETWTSMKPELGDSVCVAGSAVYVGAGSKVLRSTDGGSTWTTALDARSGATPWFGAEVQCADSSSIWVLFTGGGAAGSEAYAAYRSADGGTTWAPVVAAPLVAGSEPAFRGVAQLDAYHGPFAAVSGDEAVFLGQCPACDPQHVMVLRTQDGGATWDKQVIDGFVPTAVSFADPDHGWMTTEVDFPDRGVAILATTDGGKTWQVVSRPGTQTPATTPSPSNSITPVGQAAALDAVTFADADHGWAGGTDGILATTDGGATWTRQYSGPAGVVSLDFVDPTHGWAVATDRVLRTADGGLHWTAAGEPDGWWLTSTRFLTPQTGFGIGGRLITNVQRIHREDALFRTDDGGVTWALVQEGPNSVCFPDPSTGYAGEAHALLKSTDGGATWTRVFEPPVLRGHYLTMLECPTAEDVWYFVRVGETVMTQEGYVLFRSSDGGASFEALAVGPYVPVADPSVHAGDGLASELGPFRAMSGSTAVFLGFCAACDLQASVTVTSDGGRTFHSENVPRQVLNEGGMWFFDARHGFVAVQDVNGSGLILETGDGGRSWTEAYRT